MLRFNLPFLFAGMLAFIAPVAEAEELSSDSDLVTVRRAVLGNFVRSGPGEVSENVDDLTSDQAAMILHDLFYEPTNLAALKDKRLAYHLLDMLAVHGQREVAAIVSDALGDLLAQHPALSKQIDIKSIFDPRPSKYWRFDASTVAQLNLVVSAGYGTELKYALVDSRLDYVRATGGLAAAHGWVDRIEFFRE